MKAEECPECGTPLDPGQTTCIECGLEIGNDDDLCSCGNNGSNELHPCPFKEEIDNDDRDVCNCCPNCVTECKDRI